MLISEKNNSLGIVFCLVNERTNIMTNSKQKIHYRIISKFYFPSIIKYSNPNFFTGKNKNLIKCSDHLWSLKAQFSATSSSFFKNEKETFEYLIQNQPFAIDGIATTHEEININDLTHFKKHTWGITLKFNQNFLSYFNPRYNQYPLRKIKIILSGTGKNSSLWRNKCLIKLNREDIRLYYWDEYSDYERYHELFWRL